MGLIGELYERSFAREERAGTGGEKSLPWQISSPLRRFARVDLRAVNVTEFALLLDLRL